MQAMKHKSFLTVCGQFIETLADQLDRFLMGECVFNPSRQRLLIENRALRVVTLEFLSPDAIDADVGRSLIEESSRIGERIRIANPMDAKPGFLSKILSVFLITEPGGQVTEQTGPVFGMQPCDERYLGRLAQGRIRTSKGRQSITVSQSAGKIGRRQGLQLVRCQQIETMTRASS